MAQSDVLSPLPGIFYHRPNPDAPVFKAEGDKVAIGDVIGLIEIMKSFNEVKAEQAGVFRGYKIAHGDEIMAGQPLAVIEG